MHKGCISITFVHRNPSFSDKKCIKFQIAMRITRRKFLYQKPSLVVSTLIRNLYSIFVFYFNYDGIL